MICRKLVAFSVLVLIGLSAANEEKAQILQKVNRTAHKKSLFKDCVNSYSVTCLKLDIVSWVDKLDGNEDLVLVPGVSVVKENVSVNVPPEQVVAELGRHFANDPVAKLDAYLVKKVTGYLNSHSIKLNFWSQGADEARGRGRGKKGGLGYLLGAGAMLKGTLMALAMAGIAALAGKALMTGLISLLLSAIIGLKALTHHGGHKHAAYEIISSKPIVSHASSHSISHEHGGHYEHSAYGRSYEPSPLLLGLIPEYR